MPKNRKSIADAISIWDSVRSDPMTLTLAFIYLGLCFVFVNMKLGLEGQTQMSWTLALLPEIMLVAVWLLYILQKILTPILQATFPWPMLGIKKTGLWKAANKVSSRAASKCRSRFLYFVLTFNGLLGQKSGSPALRHVREWKMSLAKAG